MARYNTFKYGSGQKYGEIASQKYSVEPFSAYAKDYGVIDLSWNYPQSSGSTSISKIRLVRSQYSYPETQDDGIILYENTDVTLKVVFTDSNNLALGRFAFYAIWLQLSDDSWVLAGETETIVPSKHFSKIYPKLIDETNTTVFANILLQTTHERFLSYLPKIFTTNESATDNLVEDSDLSLFLQGFSFTVDEFLTYTQLVLPGLSGRYSNEAVLMLQGKQLGVPNDVNGLTKTQKKFVRDAIYIYSKKGTAVGLKAFVSSLTGYTPTITVGKNLMLSIQASTFYNGIDGWKTTPGLTMSAITSVTPPTPVTGDVVVDSLWVAAIDASSAAGGIYLGSENPITQGIPVTAGVEYSLTYQVKRTSTTGGITGQSILWYDQNGVKIGTQSQVGTTVTTSWVNKTYTLTAPAGAKFASIGLYFQQGPTYYLDMVQFAESSVSRYSEARMVYINLGSPTNLTQTRITQVPKLTAQIKNYLPINTAYYVSSGYGFETSGISS